MDHWRISSGQLQGFEVDANDAGEAMDLAIQQKGTLRLGQVIEARKYNPKKKREWDSGVYRWVLPEQR